MAFRWTAGAAAVSFLEAIVITASEYRTAVGIAVGDPPSDASIASAVSIAVARVEAFCRRTFAARAARTEYYSGIGSRALLLRHRPVASVAEIRLQTGAGWGQTPGAFGAETVLTAGVDWALELQSSGGESESGIVYRLNGVWPMVGIGLPGRVNDGMAAPSGNIRVTYTGGFVSPPDAVKNVVGALATQSLGLLAHGGQIASEAWDGYAVALVSGGPEISGIPAGLAGVLALYRGA